MKIVNLKATDIDEIRRLLTVASKTNSTQVRTIAGVTITVRLSIEDENNIYDLFNIYGFKGSRYDHSENRKAMWLGTRSITPYTIDKVIEDVADEVSKLQ